MTVTVPGNVILLGEYAVLEEGGLGAACAVQNRVRLQAEAAQELSVEGRWPGGSFAWSPGKSTSPLVSAVYRTVSEWKERQRLGAIPALRVCIDSSELYLPHGRKAGFGSSAAVTVALVIALCANGDQRTGGLGTGDQGTAGLALGEQLLEGQALAKLALAAHRLAQGGAGSGYDVYCSFFGGWGMFRGGTAPSWEAHARPARFRAAPVPGACPGLHPRLHSIVHAMEGARCQPRSSPDPGIR